MKSLSRVRLFVTPWTVVYQAPLAMVFSRQEYWSGLPFPSPGDHPKPGIEPVSPAGSIPGKGQFSFQSQRKAMPKNAQTTAQLHSSHTLVK